MPDWSRIVNTTISKYSRDREIDIFRNRKVLAMVKAKGNVEMNLSGRDLDWKIKYKRNEMQGIADTDTLTFARLDSFKTAVLPWRGYAATDAMTKEERLKNKSVEAIVDIWSDIGKSLLDDIEDNFGEEFYIDGNATGNDKRVHGVESFLGQGSASTIAPVIFPSDTYAGLSTALGNYGGTWDSTSGVSQWPRGTGDAHYDFYSPLLIEIDSAVSTANGGFASSTATWASRCLEATRFGLIHSMKNKSVTGMIDCVIEDGEWYRLFVEALAAKEHLNVNRGESVNTLYGLGFKDVTNFDGAEVTFEYGIGRDVGYGFNFDKVTLMSLQNQLFVVEGPEWDIASRSWRVSVDFHGNFKFEPRYFFKMLITP